MKKNVLLTASDALPTELAFAAQLDELSDMWNRIGAALSGSVSEQDVEDLTPYEMRVMICVTAGLSTPEIAARLMNSERTIEAHLRSVYQKFGLFGDAHLKRVQATTLFIGRYLRPLFTRSDSQKASMRAAAGEE
jgi:DNA-binding CsgD family transcriptional regulator